MTPCHDGDEDMVELNERKEDLMFGIAQYHEKEATKASEELHRIIGSSDPMMYSWRRI